MDDYVTKTYGVEHQRREIEDPRVTTLLIESDGVLIAFAQMRVATDEVEIARFYVDRPWHGRGVAQRMMRACLDVARDAGVPRVWLAVWEKNARAIAFYEKCGFRFTGSQLFILGKDVQTDRLMEMKIREATPSRP
jgi:ribosomal protein S18 acetylase RimI-like enzyme